MRGARLCAAHSRASVCLLDLCHHDLSVDPVGLELNLFADFHLLEHCRILDAEDHRHVVFVHIKALDRAVLEGDLARRLVDLLDLAVGHRPLRDCGAGTKCDREGESCSCELVRLHGFPFVDGLTDHLTTTVPTMPASRCPGIRHEYSNSPALLNFHTISSVFFGASRLPFGSSCSMSGFFFMASACLRFSDVVARMNSWSSSPLLRSMNLICSPFFTWTFSGMNIILPSISPIVTCTILVGFLASPGSPAE